MSIGHDSDDLRHGGKRVCLLTGASGRLGSAFCRMYAAKYHILAVYHNHLPEVTSQYRSYVDPLDPDAELVENEYSIYAVKANLYEVKEVERVVELALARFGRVDLLVNAAAYSVWGPLVDNTAVLDSVTFQFYLNVTVPAQIAALIARRFWRERCDENREMNRNVINVSSVAGLRLYPHLGQSIYSASKAALNQLTFHMANEFQTFGVRVNATAPNSFPQIVSVEDAAGTIVQLDEGRINGKILVLDRDGIRLTGLSPFNIQA